MSSPSVLVKLSILIAAVLLPGCLVQDLYVMHKARKDRRGDGGAYAQGIHEALYLDKSYAPSFYTGNLPADLDISKDDARTRLKADGERVPVRLTFDGVSDGRMCFLTTYVESVFHDSPAEQHRVDELFRSFRFAAELAGPDNAAENATRENVFPTKNHSLLEDMQLLDKLVRRVKGDLRMALSYRVCGKPLAPPAQPAKFLTVAVLPGRTQGDSGTIDAYLMVWQLY